MNISSFMGQLPIHDPAAPPLRDALYEIGMQVVGMEIQATEFLIIEWCREHGIPVPDGEPRRLLALVEHLKGRLEVLRINAPPPGPSKDLDAVQVVAETWLIGRQPDGNFDYSQRTPPFVRTTRTGTTIKVEILETA